MTDHAKRKAQPMARGLLDYFPNALAAVAECSRVANEQHNPGEPIHWARGKSTDHADCIIRHLVDRGTLDADGVRHSAKVAWRALALLEEELEAAGAKRGRASVDAPTSTAKVRRWGVFYWCGGKQRSRAYSGEYAESDARVFAAAGTDDNLMYFIEELP